MVWIFLANFMNIMTMDAAKRLNYDRGIPTANQQ